MRRSSAQRGYDGKWQKLRARHLAANPWCAMCLRDSSKRVRGWHVDHIVPHKGDPALFWNTANLQTLCSTHHNSAKQKQEHFGRPIGCDATGQPRDPNHHWNRR